MGQLYMQRFEYRGAIDKAAFDAAWDVAGKTLKTSGNWGNVAAGVKHIGAYGTSWGGYTLLEVEDVKAFEAYQMFHVNNYAHMVNITFEPLTDLDTAIKG